MKETLLVKKCKRRKDVNGWPMCATLHIPCTDVKQDDCPLMEEFKIFKKKSKEEE